MIASNRDEFFDRPTAPLTGWASSSGQTIYAGRDLRAGGSWFGITPEGRVALLTNVREIDATPGGRSRGELVTRWLEGSQDAAQFMAANNCSAYGGFNLIVGDVQTGQWTWLSNRFFDSELLRGSSGRPQTASKRTWRSQDLMPGVYGLSNAALDTPWPKTLGLKHALHSALEEPNDLALTGHLWEALGSQERAAFGDLPDTGLSTALESRLSSAFIAEQYLGSAGYGTRCSTVLVVGSGSTAQTVYGVSMTERSYAASAAHAALDEGAVPDFSERRIDLIWPVFLLPASTGF